MDGYSVTSLYIKTSMRKNNSIRMNFFLKISIIKKGEKCYTTENSRFLTTKLIERRGKNPLRKIDTKE